MRPDAYVYLNGTEIWDKWGPVVSSVSVTDEAGRNADSCEFVFDLRDKFPAPKIGDELRVFMGYDEIGFTYRGRYLVDEWKIAGPRSVLTVSGAAADLTSKIRAPRMRSWHEKSVKQIVETIAGEHGLTTRIDPQIGERQIDHIDQQTESDVAFLTRLASRNGATFKVADGNLLFAAKGSRINPDGTPKKAIVLTPQHLSSWDISCSKRGDYKAATAEYHDTTSGKRKSAVSGAGEPRIRDRRLYGSEEEAKAAAAAKLGALARGELTAELEMPGDPRFFAEAWVTLTGFHGDVDGEYFAKTVTHSLDDRGYMTTVSLETEGSGSEES